MYTYIKPTRENPEAYFVETWWDNSRRHYVTQIKNANLEQVVEAWYSCSRKDAKRSHIEACHSVTEGIPYIQEHIINP